MQRPTACLLVIGNEILSGRTRDSHVQTLAKSLSSLGIALIEARCIPDDHEVIVAAIQALSPRCDVLFTTGGIGPTHDDITADAVAAAFSVPLHEHPEARRRLAEYYRQTGSELNAARLRMARIPEGASLIDNPISAAPGFVLGNVYVLAGVPKIMQAMLQTVLRDLPTGPEVLSHTLELRSGEGAIAELLAQVQSAWPEVQVGSYPGSDEHGPYVQVVFRAIDQAQLLQAADQLMALLPASVRQPH